MMTHVSTMIAALCVIGMLELSSPIAAAPARVGGFADSILWAQQTDQRTALQQLVDGTMDIYMFPLRSAEDIASARANPNVWTIEGTGTTFNLLVNPMPFNAGPGSLPVNPFAKREVREALNFLIDREFIADKLTGGGFVPQVTFEGRRTPEFARNPAFMLNLERQYAFDPALGKRMIGEALGHDSDYTFDGTMNRWQFRGSDVVVDIMIRGEDIRKQIGDYVADQLEWAGFAVRRDYMTDGTRPFVITDYPASIGAWHLYTEAWAQTALTAWADTDPDFYACGGEQISLWTEYSPNPTLIDVCRKLRDGIYTSIPERQSYFEQALELAVNDSVRVWLGSGATFAVSKRVTGMVYDLAGGPWGRLATRTARFDSPGGQLNAGIRLPYLTPWNPWRGFGWLYDALASFAFTDPAVWPHPHTGRYMPLRATFSVDAPGPTASAEVPRDALAWDPSTLSFRQVVPGTNAKSSVTYNFTFGRWHDGSNFTMDDVLYELALVYRRADPSGDIHRIDSDAADLGSRRLASLLRGFKVQDSTHLQMWYDYWHPDPANIAALVNPAFPATPWTASELAMTTVLGNGPCVVSEETAVSSSREPLDFTKGRCFDEMDRAIVNLSAAAWRPPGLDGYITPGEVAVGWRSLWSFRNRTGHYYSSNGPYILSGINLTPPFPTTMEADPDYPIRADAYDASLVPRIPQIAFGPAPTVLAGRPATFRMTSTFSDQPYDQVDIVWLIRDPPTGGMFLQGHAANVAPGSFEIGLSALETRPLKSGTYELQAIAVGHEAAVPVTASFSFFVIPDVDAALTDVRQRLDETQRVLDQQLRDLKNLTAQVQGQVAAMRSLAIVSMAVAAVAVGLGAVVVLRMRPRKSRRPKPSG